MPDKKSKVEEVPLEFVVNPKSPKWLQQAQESAHYNTLRHQKEQEELKERREFERKQQEKK